jgi:catechol 2,3-dioxygenase-like lactoylglutathione lyase family enzyme
MQIEHIAVGVVDLETSIAYYREYFGYKWDGEIYVDPLQMARIAFIETTDSNLKLNWFNLHA